MSTLASRVLILLGSMLPLVGCVTTPGNYYGSSLDPHCCASGGSVVYYDQYDPWGYYGPSYGPYDYRYGYARPYWQGRGHDHHDGHHDGDHDRHPPEVIFVKPPRKPPAIFDPRPEDHAKPPPRRNPRDPGRTPHREPPAGHATKPSLPLLFQQREQRDQRAQQQPPQPQQHRPEPAQRPLAQRPQAEQREPPRQNDRREERERAEAPQERPGLNSVMRERANRNR